MNSRKRFSSSSWLLWFLAAALILVFFTDLAVASADISFRDFYHTLLGFTHNTTIEYIIYEVRLPRALTAILAGGSLALSGLLLQTLFHNPLAGPYVLGISSGAGLGVAVYTLSAATFFSMQPLVAAGGQVLAAMIGAALVFLVVLSFSWRLADTVSLLIIGIMIGALASSIVGILEYFAPPELVHRFVIWSLGSLGATSWLHLKIIIPVFFLAIASSILLIKPLDAMLMGEVHARITGVNVRRTRFMMIVISSVLVGVLTAFTGPIAFVGMTVPHMVRLVSHRVSFRFVLPGVLLAGPLLMLVCDIIAQLPGRAATLPINGVTALFGAPVVILLIIRSRKLNSSL
ncbi:MAG: iron ABC transporter permease [Bacteroidota bacterium]|nr:MAG: iron ABC transporter permease [Bacteroidota bacterium]